jgi:hypothetical protein
VSANRRVDVCNETPNRSGLSRVEGSIGGQRGYPGRGGTMYSCGMKRVLTGMGWGEMMSKQSRAATKHGGMVCWCAVYKVEGQS